MDAGTRQKRVEGLEAIKNKAMQMAESGEDSLAVRDFVTSAKKELAYELPDEEAFNKAMRATLAYKAKKGK
jgi:acyl carrier protein